MCHRHTNCRTQCCKYKSCHQWATVNIVSAHCVTDWDWTHINYMKIFKISISRNNLSAFVCSHVGNCKWSLKMTNVLNMSSFTNTFTQTFCFFQFCPETCGRCAAASFQKYLLCNTSSPFKLQISCCQWSVHELRCTSTKKLLFLYSAHRTSFHQREWASYQTSTRRKRCYKDPDTSEHLVTSEAKCCKSDCDSNLLW